MNVTSEQINFWNSKIGISGIPKTLPASDVPDWAKQPNKPTYSYSEILSAPTLLSQFTNNFVPAWALTPNKPAYSYQEVGAAPASTVSFPGFGTNHALAAYGDHNHDSVYMPLGYSPDLSAYSTKLQADNLYLGKTATAYNSDRFGGQLPSYYQPTGSYESPLSFSTGLNRVGNTVYNTVSQYTDSMTDARITNAKVLAVLGYTPYSAANPNNYITASSIPGSLPASDVYAWAKAATKPTYTYSEVGADASGAASSAISSHLLAYNHANFVTAYNWVNSYGQTDYVRTGDSRLSDARPASGGISAQVTTAYNQASNASYQMLWGSSNYIYGNSNITCNPYLGQITASQFNGTATNSNGWVGEYYDGAVDGTNLAFLMGYNSSTHNWNYYKPSVIQSWLGLGSNAYNSTAYLPLTGGTLSSELSILGRLSITKDSTPVEITRSVNNTYAGIRLNTSSINDFFIGLRETADNNLHIYSYGTNSDVLIINKATGNSTFLGSITSPTFIGSLTGSATQLGGVAASGYALLSGANFTGQLAISKYPTDGITGKVNTSSSINFGLATYGYGISTNDAGGLDIMANQAGQPIRFWSGTNNASPTLSATFNGTSVTFYGDVTINGGNLILPYSFFYKKSGVTRWEINGIGTESGSNSGSDIGFYRFSDAGGYLGQALNINRSTGNAAFSGTVTAPIFSGTLNILYSNEIVIANGFTGGNIYLNYRGATAAITNVSFYNGLANGGLTNITANAFIGSGASLTGVASSLTAGGLGVNYNSNPNSTYQMLWGSGNQVYGTAGIYCNPSTSVIYASNFTGVSDRRLKTNIKSISYNPISSPIYEFEMLNDIGKKRYGVIAQELQISHPDLVECNNGILSVKHIDVLYQEIANLKYELNQLRKSML